MAVDPYDPYGGQELEIQLQSRLADPSSYPTGGNPVLAALAPFNAQAAMSRAVAAANTLAEQAGPSRTAALEALAAPSTSGKTPWAFAASQPNFPAYAGYRLASTTPQQAAEAEQAYANAAFMRFKIAPDDETTGPGAGGPGGGGPGRGGGGGGGGTGTINRTPAPTTPEKPLFPQSGTGHYPGAGTSAVPTDEQTQAFEASLASQDAMQAYAQNIKDPAQRQQYTNFLRKNYARLRLGQMPAAQPAPAPTGPVIPPIPAPTLNPPT